LRGRILDVDITDILVTLLTRVGPTIVSKFLMDTRETQVEIYSGVLTTLINDRLVDLDVVPANVDPLKTDTVSSVNSRDTSINEHPAKRINESGLMTLSEVMTFLKISRTTLYHLRMTGALETKYIGSSVRITHASVLQYLDLD
jgi:predicted DNA-binding transcriptional regulator AlpA